MSNFHAKNHSGNQDFNALKHKVPIVSRETVSILHSTKQDDISNPTFFIMFHVKQVTRRPADSTIGVKAFARPKKRLSKAKSANLCLQKNHTPSKLDFLLCFTWNNRKMRPAPTKQAIIRHLETSKNSLNDTETCSRRCNSHFMPQ